MIPQAYINEWRKTAPWIQSSQVEQDLVISRAIYEQNMLEKRKDSQFTADIGPLLTTSGVWNFNQAFDWLMDHLLSRLPGEPWQGKET